MNDQKIQLGKDAPYPNSYSPDLLQAIPRSLSRNNFFSEMLPFRGVDVWTAYELSWLNENGVPQVAIGEFSFDCESANIIESKSFKYYLNSLNQSRFESPSILKATLERDLSAVSGLPVQLQIFSLNEPFGTCSIPGECLDKLDISVATYEYNPSILHCESDGKSQSKQALYTHLLKTNCPVTGQPDWATLWIEYSGKEISKESLLSYVISLREHQDYHETSVEKIFYDIQKQCCPHELSVFARYTRRGGLDINPYRSTHINIGANKEKIAAPFGRSCRQ